jgi:hypothetical protein
MSPVIGREALKPFDINVRFAIELPCERAGRVLFHTIPDLLIRTSTDRRKA